MKLSSKQIMNLDINNEAGLDYDKNIEASTLEVNTMLMMKTLKEYAIYLRNNGNTKRDTKTKIDSIVNELVEKDFFFSSFNVVKTLGIYVENVFKTDNLKDNLNKCLRNEYRVSKKISNNAIDNFCNLKSVKENKDINDFLNR